MSLLDLIVSWAICCAVGLLFGYVLGTVDHSGKDAVMKQFESWTRQEQREFIIEATKDKDTLKRVIAEDWCSINKNTQRACWNARLVNPIRGGK